MKTFESRIQSMQKTLQAGDSSMPIVMFSDALAIAQEADQMVSELRVALESFADFVAGCMPSNGFNAVMVRTELLAVREYLDRTNE